METVMKTSAAAGYTAAGGTMILGLTANELAAFGGLLVTILAFAVNSGVNFWFKHQELKLARERAARESATCEMCAKARESAP